MNMMAGLLSGLGVLSHGWLERVEVAHPPS